MPLVGSYPLQVLVLQASEDIQVPFLGRLSNFVVGLMVVACVGLHLRSLPVSSVRLGIAFGHLNLNLAFDVLVG